MSFRTSKPSRPNGQYARPSYVRPSYGRASDAERDPFRARGFVIARFFVLVMFAIVGLGIIAAVVSGGFWNTSIAQDCKVTDKGIAVVDGYSEYRVYTENCDVMTVADSLVDGQVNSATVYKDITVGESYDFGTRGLRVPLFSLFPNIISVQPAS